MRATQRQVAGAAAAFALGVAAGALTAAVRDDGGTVSRPAAYTGSDIAPDELHRSATLARGGRETVTDLLSAEVQPGELATASVGIELGARPVAGGVEYIGDAKDRFGPATVTFEDAPGPTLRDGTQLLGATRVTVTARNTSGGAARMHALLSCVPRCQAPTDSGGR